MTVISLAPTILALAAGLVTATQVLHEKGFHAPGEIQTPWLLRWTVF